MSEAIQRLAIEADRRASARRRVPHSTYRLQMHRDFSLPDAIGITAYLDTLGIGHAYTSSLLTAKPGSTHGYDVVDHSRLNPEIGTEAELTAWSDDLRRRGMGLLLDVVPNHMSVGGPNPWWADVLEHGPASPFANYFDIAWNDHLRDRLQGKVLLPILGQPYGAEIDAGCFRVAFADGGFQIRYNGLTLPIDPRTYGTLLTPALDTLRDSLGNEHPDVLELQSVLNAVRHLPPRSDTDPARVREGWTESRVIQRRLAELSSRNPAVGERLEAVAVEISGRPGDPASFAALEDLIEAQAYRPCFWRVASDEINYRRFFDVNDLAALSTEREEVFAAAHQKVLEWVVAGRVDGLRIDHPDGLFNPHQYLDRLQLFTRLAFARQALEESPAMVDSLTWGEAEPGLRDCFMAHPAVPLYVVVEKILGENESLPPAWPADGTTGYEFINQLNGLFVDSGGERELTRIYRDLTGSTDRFDDLVYRSKFHLLQSSLASELHVLAHQLDRLAQAQRWSRDFTLNGLRHALREVIACFPVYRSYVGDGIDDPDRQAILRAVARARHRNPLLGRAVFDFIRDTLLLKDPPTGPASLEYREAQRRFTGKFEQVTAPAMAKGFEDTALYVYGRLISLNEVGGDPSKFGRRPIEVHHYFRNRSGGGLSPLSTHDTKRSEDVRARINVLSEMPDAWGLRVGRWMELNRPHKADLGDGQVAPDANEEYFFYQTLIGVWPMEGVDEAGRGAFVERIQAYMNKVLHEAKVHSSWINPNTEYDAAVADFVARILDPQEAGAFLQDFTAFQRTIAHYGMFNSLAQSLVRCTAPGVPDTYQGTETWDLSLVDPDNRRPVDYERLKRTLSDLDRESERDRYGLAAALLQNRETGAIKLYAVAEALRLRRQQTELFQRGEYVPLDVIGPGAPYLFCFLRRTAEAAVVVLVPRLLASMGVSADEVPTGAVWGETAILLPDALAFRRWTNRYTGEVCSEADRTIPVAWALGTFPVALLVGGR